MSPDLKLDEVPEKAEPEKTDDPSIVKPVDEDAPKEEIKPNSKEGKATD